MVSRAILNGWPTVPPSKAISAPVFTVQPSISGTFAAGDVLTASPGTITGFPAPTVSYRWFRNNVDTGVTTSTYTPTTGDIGATISLAVVATNAAGSAVAYATGSPITQGTGFPAPPTGFAYVVRIRDGVTQYAVSPARNNAYAIHRSA